MSMRNYPKRFEILLNDGEIIKFRVRKLVTGVSEYYVVCFVNHKQEGRTRKITVPEVLEYLVKKSGKHTFSIFTHDPDNYEYDPNDIESEESNLPMWEQDIFVIKTNHYRLPKERIEKLALKYAPFVFLDAKERYLPSSLSYLLNKDQKTGVIKNKKLDVDVTLKFQNTRKIKMHYNDISDVLPNNGDNDSVLDTVGLSIFRLFTNRTLRDILERRKGDPKNVTIYYSYIPNSEERQQVIINYHFLYAYDSKLEAEGKTKKTSHIFDRESISVVLPWNEDKQNVGNKPEFVIYGAHLDGQTMGSVTEDEVIGDKWNSLQKWKCGRVKVKWNDVHKIKGRPTVFVAQGSHAPYPAPGHYAVYLRKRLPMLVEPAGVDKVLIPQEFSERKDMGDILKKNYTYKLKDLELGTITSMSWNRILAFCGYIVDIIGPKNAKFPPYTERELNIDQWVNGDKNDIIYDWDPKKADKKAGRKFAELRRNIIGKLS